MGDSSPSMETDSPEGASPQPMTSSPKQRWSRDYALPPCRVCARDGSGLHYGVNTCDPCKGFFQRSFTHHSKYICRADERCNLLKSRRKMCSYCRLQKCHEVGMSREGIRHGRYQLSKRQDDIREVKELQASQALAVLLVEEEKKRPSVEKLVVSLIENRSKYSRVCDEYEERFCKMDMDYLTKGDSTNVIEDIIRVTSGVTRPSNYLEQWEFVCKKIVKFAKGIPGFRELHMNDQVTLLQDSHSDARGLHAMVLCHDQMIEGILNAPVADTPVMKFMLGVLCRFTSLRLTPDELAVIMAFVILNGSTSRLVEPQKVEAVHDQLLQCLQWLLKRNHPDQPMAFCKVVEILTFLRTCTKMDEDFRQGALQLMEAGTVVVPPLLRELTPPSSNPVDLNCDFHSYYERYFP